jgi:hypothetical protein
MTKEAEKEKCLGCTKKFTQVGLRHAVHSLWTVNP